MALQALELEVASALASFTFNQAALDQMLRSSPVAADLARRAIRVESQAKVYATGVDGGPNVRTGRLRGSITWRLGEDSEGVYADVGTAVHYGFWLEVKDPAKGGRPFLRPALKAAAD